MPLRCRVWRMKDGKGHKLEIALNFGTESPIYFVETHRVNHFNGRICCHNVAMFFFKGFVLRNIHTHTKTNWNEWVSIHHQIACTTNTAYFYRYVCVFLSLSLSLERYIFILELYLNRAHHFMDRKTIFMKDFILKWINQNSLFEKVQSIKRIVSNLIFVQFVQWKSHVRLNMLFITTRCFQMVQCKFSLQKA